MLFLSSQRARTNDFGVTAIVHKQPSPVSNLTTTKKVDTDSRNDDNTQSFSIHIKQHGAKNVTETTTMGYYVITFVS